MRLIPLLLTCSIAAGLARPAVGADVILRDGQVIATKKPYVVKGKIAILTRTDGSLVSIPVEEIDLGKTAAAAAVKPAAPKTEPTPAAPKKPTTPAEAARVKPGKRATVVLTDADVRTSVPAEPEGEKTEKGDGEVSISGTNATRTKSGYSINGSVVNSGKGDVRGASVTIELVGENSKTLATTRGILAKDLLAPGEKSTFTAEVESETEAKSFRYLPSWQVTVPVKAAEPGSASKPETASSSPKPPPPELNPAPGSAPKSDKAEATPQPIPRPDVAPPSANPPVGAPSTPGGVYIPRPSDNQPGQPKAP
jgi:hypothetical protein